MDSLKSSHEALNFYQMITLTCDVDRQKVQQPVIKILPRKRSLPL